MSGYYESWSANKRKKNPTRSHARVSSDRPWLQQQQQQQQQHHTLAPILATTSASASAASASSVVSSLNEPPSRTSAATRHIFSPVLPRYTSDVIAGTSQARTVTTDGTKSLTNLKQRTATWRFPIALFDSSLIQDDTTGNNDYDDVDMDDDDDDDDGDNEEDKEHEHQGIALPILPATVGFTQTSSTSTQRRSLFWADYQPRLVQVREQRELENDIEQLDTTKDESSGPGLTYTNSMAHSSPSLSASSSSSPSSPAVDDPQSTSTFNTCLYPRPILRDTARISGGRPEGRRLRPWSQVIWESPVLSEPPHSQPRQPHPRFPSNLEHSVTIGAQPQCAYPALTRDLFTPLTAPEKERVVSRSVRINIEGDITNTTTAGSTADTRVPTRRSNSNGVTGNLLPMVSGRREHNNGRKHTNNRLSLGSAFYASIEPISLSAATPSTPRTRRQLVKLPARPQSVLIPSTSSLFTAAGGQPSAFRHGPAPQLLGPESSKRRRHKSQQLDLRGASSSTVVPIPWLQLAPMSARDNAKTFHGIGSSPVVPIPMLKIEAPDATFEKMSFSQSTTGSDPTLELGLRQSQSQPRPNHLSPSPHQEEQTKLPWLTKSYPLHMHISKHLRSSHSQPQSQSQTQPASFLARAPRSTPARFLPSLIETSSSFFKQPSLSSSSVPKRRTCGFEDSAQSSSSTARLGQPIPAHFPDTPTRDSHSFRRSPVQTRNSLPTHTAATGAKRDGIFSRSRRTMTASVRSATPLPNRNNGTNSTSDPNTHDITTVNNNFRNSVLFNSTRLSSWKRNSSVLFPFSLVSYESGGLLGEIKNTSTTICTNAPSPVVAPGTPLPPGVIVSTGVPTAVITTATPTNPGRSPSTTAATAVLGTPMLTTTHSRDSLRSAARSKSPLDESSESSWSSDPHSSTESDSEDRVRLSTPCTECCSSRISSANTSENTVSNDCSCECHYYYYTSSSDTESMEDEDEGDGIMASMDGSVVIQKSHVAVYEINPRWGSRLMMFLITVGGILCGVSGGLCAEHHCKDLQLCPDEYHGHGDWCGPSGVEGAPYMLTVGMSMCLFGMYALCYLRSPVSRLVGYSEIDQFLQ